MRVQMRGLGAESRSELRAATALLPAPGTFHVRSFQAAASTAQDVFARDLCVGLHTNTQPERHSVSCFGLPASDTKRAFSVVLTLALSNHEPPLPKILDTTPAPSPSPPSLPLPTPQPPHFWGGSFNATAKSLKKKCKKHTAMLVAVTARSCGHCIDFEPAYRWAVLALSRPHPKPQILNPQPSILNPKP